MITGWKFSGTRFGKRQGTCTNSIDRNDDDKQPHLPDKPVHMTYYYNGIIWCLYCRSLAAVAKLKKCHETAIVNKVLSLTYGSKIRICSLQTNSIPITTTTVRGTGSTYEIYAPLTHIKVKHQEISTKHSCWRNYVFFEPFFKPPHLSSLSSNPVKVKGETLPHKKRVCDV